MDPPLQPNQPVGPLECRRGFRLHLRLQLQLRRCRRHLRHSCPYHRQYLVLSQLLRSRFPSPWLQILLLLRLPSSRVYPN